MKAIYTQAFILLAVGALPVSLLYTSGHGFLSVLCGCLVLGVCDGFIAARETALINKRGGV